MSKTEQPEKISEADLKHKLQSFQDGIQGRVDDKKSTLLTVGAGMVVVLIVVFFLLGKRSGRKKTTLVEIKRI